MRSYVVPCALLGSLYVTIACGDSPPVYPPLPMISNGAQSSGAQGSGANGNSSGSEGGKSSNPGKGGNAGSSVGDAGEGNLPGGGSQGTGGSSNPTGDVCADFAAGEPAPEPTTACDLGALVDGGTLTGDLNSKTLESGKSYLLKGVTRVLPGQTLTIPPCVEIRGENPLATLVVLSGTHGTGAMCSIPAGSGPPVPGGKLVAKGEPNAPIIFTSNKPKGQRAPGDWGGVLMLGNAINNQATAIAGDPVEGLEVTECGGYHTDEYNEESSGALEYVRIEFASRQTGTAQETNGLTLSSLGSGTSIHHVMVSNSNDDCFEWFGGTVNAHHLIALNCDDDMFDADKGFSGHVQFLFGRQYPQTSEGDSRGFEIDSLGKLPRTTAQWSNFTICGGGSKDAATSMGLNRSGIVLRTVSQGSLINGIVTGFKGGGVSAELTETTLTYSNVFDNNGRAYGPSHQQGSDWITKQAGNSAEPLALCDCWANPPAPVAKQVEAGIAPAGFGVPDANYRGAFASSGPDSNWMTGLWVDWSDK